jgi:hypothetical protein
MEQIKRIIIAVKVLINVKYAVMVILAEDV